MVKAFSLLPFFLPSGDEGFTARFSLLPEVKLLTDVVPIPPFPLFSFLFFLPEEGWEPTPYQNSFDFFDHAL